MKKSELVEMLNHVINNDMQAIIGFFDYLEDSSIVFENPITVEILKEKIGSIETLLDCMTQKRCEALDEDILHEVLLKLRVKSNL